MMLVGPSRAISDVLWPNYNEDGRTACNLLQLLKSFCHLVSPAFYPKFPSIGIC